MKTTLQKTALFVIALTMFTRYAHAQDVPPSVVNITNNRGQCTGVVFDSRGYIFTAEHCGIESGTVTFPDGTTSRVTRVYDAVRNNIDEAVILKTEDDGPYPYSKMAAQVSIGEKVYSWGYPAGKLSYNEGTVKKINDWVWVDYTTLFGNSGGPLFNSKNEIAGILSGTVDPFRTGESLSKWIHIHSGVDAIEAYTRKKRTQSTAGTKPVLYIFGTKG